MKTIVFFLISFSSFAQTLDFIAPRRTDFSVGYQAIIDRCLALPGCTIPSYSQQIAQNILYNSLPSGLDIFYCFATDGNETFAQINWITPASFQCSPVNSPSFIKNQGYYGNGSSSYLNTTWIPNTHGSNYAVSNASMFVKIINNTTGSNTMVSMGASGSSHIAMLLPRNVSNLFDFRINSSSSTSDTYTVSGTSELAMVSRLNTTQVRLHLDGVIATTASENSTARPTQAVYIEALNNAGTAGFFSSRGVAFAGAGNGLSGLEDDLYTAGQTYMENINVWGNTHLTLGLTGVKFNN